MKINGQPLLDFDVSLTDRVWQGTDGRSWIRYSVMEANGKDSNGVLEIGVPSSFLHAGQSVQFEVLGTSSNSQRWFGIYILPENVAALAR